MVPGEEVELNMTEIFKKHLYIDMNRQGTGYGPCVNRKEIRLDWHHGQHRNCRL